MTLTTSHTVDSRTLEIYERWHETVARGAIEETAALYSENATLETPLVLMVSKDMPGGVIVGRDNIKSFFLAALQQYPRELSKWYRTGTFFTNGRQLTWEYPREVPDGEQPDIMEMMDIEDGFIVRHRVYWGWYGLRLLASRALGVFLTQPPE